MILSVPLCVQDQPIEGCTCSGRLLPLLCASGRIGDCRIECSTPHASSLGTVLNRPHLEQRQKSSNTEYNMGLDTIAERAVKRTRVLGTSVSTEHNATCLVPTSTQIYSSTCIYCLQLTVDSMCHRIGSSYAANVVATGSR